MILVQRVDEGCLGQAEGKGKGATVPQMDETHPHDAAFRKPAPPDYGFEAEDPTALAYPSLQGLIILCRFWAFHRVSEKLDGIFAIGLHDRAAVAVVKATDVSKTMLRRDFSHICRGPLLDRR